MRQQRILTYNKIKFQEDSKVKKHEWPEEHDGAEK